MIPVTGGRGYVPVCEAEQPREAPADEVVRGYITDYRDPDFYQTAFTSIKSCVKILLHPIKIHFPYVFCLEAVSVCRMLVGALPGRQRTALRAFRSFILTGRSYGRYDRSRSQK